MLLATDRLLANPRAVQARNDIEVPDPAAAPLEAWELFDTAANGPKEKSVTVKNGADLFALSNERAAHRQGYEVAEIIGPGTNRQKSPESLKETI